MLPRTLVHFYSFLILLLPLFSTTLAKAGGYCSFQVQDREECNTSPMGHFIGSTNHFIDITYLYAVADNALSYIVLPNTDKPINALNGNGLSKDQEKDWGGAFKWLPYTTMRTELVFEWNGKQWSEHIMDDKNMDQNGKGKEGFGCKIVGDWTKDIKCGLRDKGDITLPRNRTFNCFFNC